MRRSAAVRTLLAALTGLVCVALLAACGSAGSSGSASSGGGSSNSASGGGTPVTGGTLMAGIVDNPDHLDSGLSYTNEGWELLESTNNGLLTFKKAAGGAGADIVPDLATTMPTVSDGGKTYTFHVRTGVRFSPPVNRDVEPSDIKYSIERLFRIDSGGVGFYTGIAGAAQYSKTRKGQISGIVASDAAHTITFHLTTPDGTFLEYMAMPFAFAMPRGTPSKDVSTLAKWRVATGPYMISQYVPKDHITLVRNPNFHSWSPNVPNGYLDSIHVQIGVTPDQAVTEVANGQLDFYFEQVAPDRLTAITAQHPSQVHNYVRNNITFFTLNTRKPPMNNLKVRQAIEYATNRDSLVKVFGGQGSTTENVIPPGFGSAFAKHSFYPYDLAKAKALVDASGTKGMAVPVWASNTDPQPEAAQYMASVLDSLGYKATVKTLDEGVYYDTVAAQTTDPAVSYNDWNEDFPEGEDFVDLLFNGEKITNVGNNNGSNFNVPALNKQMDAARELPLGAQRNAAWAKLDAEVMRYAPLVPFMNRRYPKFDSARLHGLVFNGTYYELLPSMWISK